MKNIKFEQHGPNIQYFVDDSVIKWISLWKHDILYTTNISKTFSTKVPGFHSESYLLKTNEKQQHRMLKRNFFF